MKGLNEFLNEAELTESKREVGKYYNAARKARAKDLTQVDSDYTNLVKLSGVKQNDARNNTGASFNFIGADGDWIEIYYDEKQEKVLMAKNDGIVNSDFHTKGSISIEDMLKLI
tara:strand:- start:1119 stop:1460 length:342 start_codon:yes stop_codon:yes gene_type:complete